MRVGYDKNGAELKELDICKFKSGNKDYEGMIVYDEDAFSYAFEMLDDHFPLLLMVRADLNSIERVINVWSTSVDDEKYKPYQALCK